MKRVNRLWAVLGMAALLGLSSGSALAQQDAQGGRQRGGGNFDPAEFQKRMMERVREQLEVKSDDEWKIIEPRVTKVMEAQRDARMGGGFGRGGRGGPGGGGADQGGGNRNRPGTEPNPDAEALQKAVEAKAPAEEIKAKLAKFREAKKAKEANLAKAQDELKKVLSLRQEATAVMSGWLQ